MHRAAAFLALALCACSPASPPAEQARAVLTPCESITFTGALSPTACALQVGEYSLDLTYHGLTEGVVAGTVSAEVRDADGAVVQSLIEPDVAEYRAPQVQDIDGDGRADFIMMRTGGAANADMALWVLNGERGVFERVGAVNGVSVEHTEMGLISAARSSAVEWEVTFHQLDEGGLHPVAEVTVTAPAGRSSEPGCRVNSAPRGVDDDISTIVERHGELCAAATRVFNE